jgi:hypothetical protein
MIRLAPLDPARWTIVNDGVMGGRSEGHLSESRVDGEAALRFHGTLRTRGGGFTSIRSLDVDPRISECTEVVLRVRGDGRRYECDLRESARLRGREVTWRSSFTAPAKEWTLVTLPLEAFEPTWRGRVLDRRRIEGSRPFWHASGSVGFTIADGRDGAFELEISDIRGR